jgi:hypothetical protein
MPEPMLYTELPALPDIDKVPPLNRDDFECLAAVRRVLEQHGALQRFGISLLHSHFPLADDEVLIESVDYEDRVLTHYVDSRDRLDGGSLVGTTWRLDDLPESSAEWTEEVEQALAMKLCRNVCEPGPKGHVKRHKEIKN